MNPIIGIVSKNITMTDFFDWSWQRISNDVRYSVNKNGGLALGILPQTLRQKFNLSAEPENIPLSDQEKDDLKNLIDMCDGIILPGGISTHNYEEFIAKHCYENDIPLLGICSGYNNIIRGLGGVAIKNDNLDLHDRPDLKYAHKCKVIDKDSLFYSIVQDEEFWVNSIHSYIGVELPSTLKIVALSEDGQIEVVEAKDRRFFMGVKYHPEMLVDEDEKQNKIFVRFIQACAKKGHKGE